MSVTVFLEEINIWINGLNKVNGPFQCEWALSNFWRIWIEQKCRGWVSLLSTQLIELEHKSYVRNNNLTLTCTKTLSLASKALNSKYSWKESPQQKQSQNVLKCHGEPSPNTGFLNRTISLSHNVLESHPWLCNRSIICYFLFLDSNLL